MLITISFFLLFSSHVVFATEFNNEYMKITEQLYDRNLSEEEIKQDIYSKYENIVKIELITLEEPPKLIEVFEEKIINNDIDPLSSFAVVIPYDEDGYSGELNRQDDTINISEKNIESKPIALERYETFYYSNLEDNDVSYIDKEININEVSMKLKSLKFIVSSYKNIGTSRVPATYDAVAKYSYMYTEELQSTNYIATVAYSNNLKRISNYKATITYEDTVKKLEYDKKLAESQKPKEVKDITEPNQEEKKEQIKEQTKEDIIEKPKADPTAFFNALKSIFSTIILIVLIVLGVLSGVLLYYFATNIILVYSTSFNGIVLLGRTKITKNDNGFEIGLTKFSIKTDSSVYKLVIPKKISKKYIENTVNVSLIRSKKKYVKQIVLKEDTTDYEISF